MIVDGPVGLLYHGIAGQGHSWGVVAGAILKELRRRGLQGLKILPTDDPAAVDPALHDALIAQTAFTRSDGGAVRWLLAPPAPFMLGYTIPPNLGNVHAQRKLLIWNHDGTVLPPGFAAAINAHADLVLPSSRFSRDLLQANGVEASRLHVLPHGFDPALFDPAIPAAPLAGIDDGRFRFLTVATPHWRKGHDLLLRAYIEAFRDDPGVVLIVRAAPDRDGPPHAQVDLQAILDGLQRTHPPPWPEIRFVDQRVPALAGLYNACDCMVLPSRFECFSLTALEAAACALPVITTRHGGVLDFLDDDSAFLIDCTLRPAPPQGQYWHFDPAGLCAEPDLEHLKQLMRQVRKQPQQAGARAARAQRRVQDLRWTRVVDALLDECTRRGWDLLGGGAAAGR